MNGFEQEYKTKYIFKGGADAKRLNDLLKSYGYEKAREIVKLVKGLYQVERDASALGLDHEGRKQLRLRR